MPDELQAFLLAYGIMVFICFGLMASIYKSDKEKWDIGFWLCVVIPLTPLGTAFVIAIICGLVHLITQPFVIIWHLVTRSK